MKMTTAMWRIGAITLVLAATPLYAGGIDHRITLAR